MAGPLGSSNLSIVVRLNMASTPVNRMSMRIPAVIRPIKMGMVKKPTQSYAYSKVPLLTLKGWTCKKWATLVSEEALSTR